MPHVFPSGQFPPGACGQVRPVGATLPTAARRAPYAREAADGIPAGKHVTPGPQSPAAGTGRSATCVDRWRGQPHNKDTLKHGSVIRTVHNDTRMAIWRVQRIFSHDTHKHEKRVSGDLSSEDSFKARRLPTLPPGLAVPSAMTGLASLFGMGRGGAPSLSPPLYIT